MRINVKAKPGSRTDKVEKIDGSSFVVSVREPPIQGRANAAIIKILGEYFNTSSVNVKIISGHTSRNKVIEITK